MKVGILGRNSFIGSELWKRFEHVYNYPRKDLDYIFWLSAPSSQVLFNHAPEYSNQQTVDSFINILRFCLENNIKLIYPSSATIYTSKDTYAATKMYLEYLQSISAYKNVLALRIFAGYGPGEKHKNVYASIIYQFCKDMKNGKAPIIYGDGTQTRDFIYIEDIIDNIVSHMDDVGAMDIGTGISHSFNEVVDLINEELKTNIKPIYIDSPEKYVQETICGNPVKFQYSLREGIKEVLACL